MQVREKRDKFSDQPCTRQKNLTEEYIQSNQKQKPHNRNWEKTTYHSNPLTQVTGIQTESVRNSTNKVKRNNLTCFDSILAIDFSLPE